jgi:hypothetical protein
VRTFIPFMGKTVLIFTQTLADKGGISRGHDISKGNFEHHIGCGILSNITLDTKIFS